MEDTQYLPPVWKEKPCPIKVNCQALIHVQGVGISFLGSGMAAANAASLGQLRRVLKLISVEVLQLISEGWTITG